MPSTLSFTQQDGIAVVTLEDPPYNRMSLEFIDELEVVVNEIAADNAIRSWVLTGAGEDNFSVGMILKQMGDGIARAGGPEALFAQRHRVIAAIEYMGKPSVVTLYGYCLGGGLEIPLGCHFRLAAETGAQIGLPEMDLGAVPAWGGSARLVRCVGRDHALDMILRAKKISGPEALRIGLVQEIWPLTELKDRAIALAQELARQPAGAVRSMLDVLIGSEERSFSELLAAESRAVMDNMGTADAIEGMNAFLEKRPPVFNREQ